VFVIVCGQNFQDLFCVSVSSFVPVLYWPCSKLLATGLFFGDVTLQEYRLDITRIRCGHLYSAILDFPLENKTKGKQEQYLHENWASHG
jgi:hypothetical protein